MEIRETEDHTAVLRFITSNHYPYVWTVESLALHRILSFEHDGVLVGYLWFTTKVEGLLEIHVCVTPPFVGRWLTRSLLVRLCSIGVETGAHSVLGVVDRPFIERIYRRLGARIAGPFAILPLKEITNGLSRSVDPVAPAAAPAA